MPKKIIIISITLFVIIGGVMLGYYFFANNSNSTDTTNNTDTTSGYPTFNPFGTGTKTSVDNTTVNNTDNTNTIPETPTVTPISKFHKITDFAVAGAGFFEDTRPLPEEIVTTTATVATPVVTPAPTKTKSKNKKTPTPKVVLPAPKVEIVPSLRYVERATGHIHQIYLDTNTGGEVSNSTIPGIYEAIFDGKAKSVIYRYTSTIDNSITSFLATLGGASSFLPPNILTVSLSQDKSKFFYLAKNSNGVTGTIGSFEETKKTQIFTSPFSEWLPQWVNDKAIFLTTKPSYLVSGALFNMNTSNGYLTKVFGGIPGLTTLANNKGEVVLYSASLDVGPRLGIFNVTNHTTKDLSMYGLPEKCIWSLDNINIYCAIPRVISGNQYPDIWYQGLVSFDDNFIKINTITGGIVALGESSDTDPIDGTNLFLSKDENTLFFINKKDSTLWSLDLR